VTAERIVGALERGRMAWVVVAVAAVLAVLPALHWSVPDEQGIPFVIVWAGVVAAGSLGFAAWRRRAPRALEAVAIVAGSAVLIGDITLLPSQALRDLDIYLRAGAAWWSGGPVYLDHLATSVPVDRSMYPFLYPPLTLPLFGFLAALPRDVVHAGWLSVSAGLALVALRSFGLSWPWALAALLWRPFAEGLWVGNVAVPVLAAFAVAPRAGSLLALPAVFKIYTAIPALWLIRERRWRAAAAAMGLVAGLGLVTLPLVGLDSWRAWLTGLAWWDASAPGLGAYASGFALERWLGRPIALAAALAVILIALRARGRDGLWRLGAATPFASPAVFAHGLLTALPALLALRPSLLWLALAATAVAPGLVFWMALALAIAAWRWPALRSAASV